MCKLFGTLCLLIEINAPRRHITLYVINSVLFIFDGCYTRDLSRRPLFCTTLYIKRLWHKVRLHQAQPLSLIF